jgi:purine-binding chemotaxis protein CheW
MTVNERDGGAGRGVASRQVATFFLNQLYFGIDVVKVQEVLRHQPLTTIPLAPPAIEGLLNLRGQIITVIDLRRRLAMPPRADGDPPMHIVVRTADGVVSLMVDAIGDVVDVSEAHLAPTPATLDSPLAELVRGIFALEDDLLLWLDEERAAAVGGPGVETGR